MSEWIEWTGGERPVPGVRSVDLRFPDGSECQGGHASSLRWEHTGESDDIVAYRIAEPTPTVTPVASISAARKAMPLFSGCLMYFPDALLAVAEHSRKANDKHNPGEPLHWAKDKSSDHADCIGRHLVDIGPKWNATDPEFGSYHATALAWRSLALLQTVIEQERAAKVAA